MIGSLWAARHEVPLEAVVLNSPWLDMQGSFLLRTAGTQAINQVGARRPYQSIPRHVSGLYGRSLHADFDGANDIFYALDTLQKDGHLSDALEPSDVLPRQARVNERRDGTCSTLASVYCASRAALDVGADIIEL